MYKKNEEKNNKNIFEIQICGCSTIAKDSSLMISGICQLILNPTYKEYEEQCGNSGIATGVLEVAFTTGVQQSMYCSYIRKQDAKIMNWTMQCNHAFH